jgi:hypothetical protein
MNRFFNLRTPLMLFSSFGRGFLKMLTFPCSNSNSPSVFFSINTQKCLFQCLRQRSSSDILLQRMGDNHYHKF